MTDAEFIEKVREIIQLPIVSPGTKFFKSSKSTEIKYTGNITDHLGLISELFEEYDGEKTIT